MKIRDSRRSWSPLRTAFVVLLAIPFIYPFAFLIMTAVKSQREYVLNPVGWPHSPTGENFSYAWNAAHLGHAMVNSVIAVSTGVVVACGLGAAAAFWFRRHTGWYAKILLIVMIGAQVLPWTLWLIPFFINLSNWHLTNNLVVLGVVYGALNGPFATWLMWSFYRQGIPGEVLEAAEVDGAGVIQQFARVVLPLSIPGLATVAALTFVFMWGELLFAVILMQDTSKLTLTAAAAALVGQFNPAIQATAAAALVAIAPMLIVFAVAQRAIMRGITAGVGK